jgi:SAM-dependent methyltransferase
MVEYMRKFMSFYHLFSSFFERIINKYRSLGRVYFHTRPKIRGVFSLAGLKHWERLVEYPWLLRSLKLVKVGSRILDVGCAEGFLHYELIAKGYEVWGIDIRDEFPKHPNLRFIKGDIMKSPFPDNFFDAVIAISTVERIGLSAYGDALCENGDFEAMEEIHRILRKDGLAFITLPFWGSFRVQDGYRLYDKDRLHKLRMNYVTVKRRFFCYFGKGLWFGPFTDEEIDSVLLNRSPWVTVCLLLKK